MSTGWRTVVLDRHERLELKNDCIVLKDEEHEQQIPLDQVRDLMISVPSGSITLPLLQRLTEDEINVVLCDGRRSPAAQVIRLNQHTEAAGRLMDQAAWTGKRKEAAWKQIARAKILMQADLLFRLNLP